MMEKVIEKTAMQLHIEDFSVVQPVIWNCYEIRIAISVKVLDGAVFS